ncbi:MAG: NADP-dependent malic enzyme [Candidatus Parcubacteria bacterium]|nr:MAG: malate dehydrogenase [Candidatus Parcubacteria bacterium]
MDIYQESLELHRQHQGKLAVATKVPLKDKADLARAYTPGVAEVCRLIAANPDAAKTHTLKGNTVAVVSDGSAILGLGNLGAKAALPVMEGKAALFKEFANVDAFPICLDTQDTEEIIKIVKAIAPSFGGINLEDISAPRCFEIEDRLKEELDIPVFHDDQHGTAVVILAGLINGLKLKNLAPEKVKVVIAGAGAAGLAVADLLLKYGFSQLIINDSKGALSLDRQDLNEVKRALAQRSNQENFKGTLKESLVGADVFIGVSAPNLIAREVVATMAPEPLIFALSNPVPEIMPDEAKAGGALAVATGRSDFPNQINNVLVFPGIFRGALDNNVSQITDAMLIKAAENLAALVEEPTVDYLLPDAFDPAVAKAVAAALKN